LADILHLIANTKPTSDISGRSNLRLAAG
jgi:hypothetical protein